VAQTRKFNALVGLAILVVIVLGWFGLQQCGRSPESGDGDGAANEEGPAKTAILESAKPRPLGELDVEGDAKATLSGTVRTRGAGPIAGAQVCAWQDHTRLRGLPGGEPRCTITDAAGAYRIEGLWPVETNATASAPEHQPSKWRRPGSQTRWQPEIALEAGKVRTGIDFELERGGSKITGIVKDLSGGEIEGARVREAGGMFQNEYGGVTSTDDQGRFELWTRSGEVGLEADAEGYASTWLPALSPSGSIELVLTPESVLVGFVVDAETDEPEPNIEVWAQASGFGGDRTDSVRTDDEGRFRISRLHPASYKIHARGETLLGEASTLVHLGLGQTSASIEIRVHPASYVEGRIVEAGSERACSEGRVTLVRLDVDSKHSGRGDLDGNVQIGGLLPGRYGVSVSCTGTVSETSYPEIEIELGAEPVVAQVWKVRSGQAIRGVVVDADGQPVVDERVSASMIVDPDDPRAQATSGSARTGEAGEFELSGLLAGRYEISVFGERPGPSEPVVITLDPGIDRNDVRIELPASASVRGRVVDENGVVQLGLAVSIKPLGGGSSVEARTDDAGNFFIEHAPLGKARVAVLSDRWGNELRKPGSTDDDVQGEPVELVAGQTAQVELVIESRSGVIRGKVLDEHASPVGDAFISVERMSDSTLASPGASSRMIQWDVGRQPHLSEPDGSFTVEGLSEGKYVVRAYRKGGGEGLVENVASGSSVEIRLVASGELGGVVTLVGGGEIESFTITAKDDALGLRFSDRFFKTKGKWSLTALPPGNYTLTAESPTASASTTIELAEGGVRNDIELQLQSRVTVKGRLVDLDTRAGIAGIHVSVSKSGSSFGVPNGDEFGEQKNVSDADGRFEVERVTTGRVQIIAMPRTWTESGGYQWTFIHRTLPGEPAEQDLGELVLVASRLKADEKAGDLGFERKQGEPGGETEDIEQIVGLVRPGGPADLGGLVVDDVIETVDGTAVSGTGSDYWSHLVSVPPGTTLEFGLQGGKVVTITVGPPIK
jgi:hypothetical protein